MIDTPAVEIVIRNTQPPKQMSPRAAETLKRYLSFDTEGKIVSRVPYTWEGFKNGVALELMREYGDNVLFVLSHFTFSDDDQVFSFDGEKVPGFESAVGGVSGWRFNKKRLLILRRVNEVQKIYEASAFILNMKFQEPVVNIMHTWMAGADGAQALRSVLSQLSSLV